MLQLISKKGQVQPKHKLGSRRTIRYFLKLSLSLYYCLSKLSPSPLETAQITDASSFLSIRPLNMHPVTIYLKLSYSIILPVVPTLHTRLQMQVSKAEAMEP